MKNERSKVDEGDAILGRRRETRLAVVRVSPCRDEPIRRHTQMSNRLKPRNFKVPGDKNKKRYGLRPHSLAFPSLRRSLQPTLARSPPFPSHSPMALSFPPLSLPRSRFALLICLAFTSLFTLLLFHRSSSISPFSPSEFPYRSSLPPHTWGAQNPDGSDRGGDGGWFPGSDGMGGNGTHQRRANAVSRRTLSSTMKGRRRRGKRELISFGLVGVQTYVILVRNSELYVSASELLV